MTQDLPGVRPGLVIWGTGGHARVVADIVRLTGQYELAGFLDDIHRDRYGTLFGNVPVLGGQEQLDGLAHRGIEYVILGFGDNAARLRQGARVQAQGLRLATVVHPGAIVAGDVALGPGTVVVAGAVVNPGAAIGANAIINTCASVDHDCVIADGVHLSPGVRLAGGVTVGRGTWVGIGAVVRDGVHIGAGAIVGAGAVVLKDIPDGAVAYGVPARVVRVVAKGDEA